MGQRRLGTILLLVGLGLVTHCSDNRSDQPRTQNLPQDPRPNGTDCKSLRVQVDNVFREISSCRQHSDCVLTRGLRRTGYQCKEMGYHRSADTSTVAALLQQFQSECSKDLFCTEDFVTTDRPCRNGYCVGNVDGYR